MSVNNIHLLIENTAYIYSGCAICEYNHLKVSFRNKEKNGNFRQISHSNISISHRE